MQTIFPATARWIWRCGAVQVNEYSCFRRQFTLSQVPAEVPLYIAVDSDYRLSVNGHEVYGRQFSDYPQYRSYNTHQIAALLQTGNNVVSVLAYYRGQNSSEHRAGRAGLLLWLDAGKQCIVSDSQWQARLSPAHCSGPLPKVSRQMGFTTSYDARLDDDWESLQYLAGNDWGRAVELAGPTDGYWQSLRARPLPLLRRGPLLHAAVIERGGWQAGPQNLSPACNIAAAQRYPDAIVAADQPWYVITDLGSEQVGLLYLEVEAPAGTVLEIAHGEHLDDGHVRALLGDREFADRYICRSGRQTYVLPFRRFGCRYIEIYVRDQTGPVQLFGVGLLPIGYELPPLSEVEVSDHRWAAIDRIAYRTLDLCMHEHYEDCPWREQALYAFDSRNQALYGYYAFGEYSFPRESFRLLGWGQRADGLLELCAPAKVAVTIPTFSLAWIGAIHEHLLFSGDPVLGREFEGVVERILEAFLVGRDPETGLAQLFHGPGYWTFYEWAAQLQTRQVEPVGRFDAPHNLFLIEALEAAAAIYGNAARWRQAAAELRQAVHKVFWQEKDCCYQTFFSKQCGAWHVAELTQALALALGLPGQPALRLGVPTAAVPLTLSSLPYAARAMLGAPLDQQCQLLHYCRMTFGGMLEQGATSLWETTLGAADFDGAGSLCHAWSSLPVWLLRAYVLGVRPQSPGFDDVIIQPHPGDLQHAAGTVPTPHGPIQVAWRRDGDSIYVNCRAPRQCRVRLEPSEQSLRYHLLPPGAAPRGARGQGDQLP